MNLAETEKIINSLIDTFIASGNLSLDLRKKGLEKKIKSDNTSVTNADIEVNNLITKKISNLTPNIKIVSEETSSNKENNSLNDFWLIDPIDGTDGYIHGKDEFTINAALILNKKPVAGIVNAPDKGRLFYSFGYSHSYEINSGSKKTLTCKKKSKQSEVNAITYSNNLKPEIVELHKKYNITNFTKMKSSIKFCVIASGDYDFYAADPRAYEWDYAAGHAILENAGGSITTHKGEKFSYGKKYYKNLPIVAKRSSSLEK